MMDGAQFHGTKWANTQREDMTDFTRGNKDDVKNAVDGLAQFCHSWCMNCEKTEKQHDLVFRCEECPFKTEGGYCSVKMFVNQHGTDEQKRTAFSMS